MYPQRNPEKETLWCSQHGKYTGISNAVCRTCVEEGYIDSTTICEHGIDYTECEECEEPPYYTLPVYWASYIIKGDASGLEEGEAEEIDAFLKVEGYPQFTDVSESWFDSFNDGDVAKFYYYLTPATAQTVTEKDIASWAESWAENLKLLLQDKESEKVNQIRDENGRLPAYAWPGGYPLYYVVRDSMSNHDIILCPEHANEEELEALVDEDYALLISTQDTFFFKVLDYDANMEDEDLWCEHGHRIESAYGDPVEPEDSYLGSMQLGSGVAVEESLPVEEGLDTVEELIAATYKETADREREAGAFIIPEPEAFRVTIHTSDGTVHTLEGTDLIALREEKPESVKMEDFVLATYALEPEEEE